MRSLFGLFLAAVLAVPAAMPADAAMRMSAWVPSWDPAALEAMRLHAGKLDETNPGWYTMGRDGGIVANWGADDLNMRAALSGTAIVPTIKNYIDGRFDGNAVATVIATEASRLEHVDALVDLVVQKGYSGIDVDYEKIPTTSRAHFSAFVQLLATELHRHGAQLSVTVHAKTSDEDAWNGPGGQDWVAIGQAADTVKIMAYDYHWSTSGAGPIAPLAWLDRVATYAGLTIGPGKVIIGLPWYGYDWLGTAGQSVTYATATANAAANGATIGRDENGEATYAYAGRVVYFQDVQSYQAKLDYLLTRHGSIAGFAHWRVGSEDPAIWDVVESLKLNGTTTGTSPAMPAGDFAISGDISLEVQAGDRVSSQFTVLPIDGFTGTVTAAARTIGSFTASVSLDKATVAPNEPFTVTIDVPSKTDAGNYQVILTLTSGSILREAVIDVAVADASKPKRRSTKR